MRLGIETAFYEANQSGGVHGRQLQLKTLDDSYETEYAFHTTKLLIEKERVFALIGAVGTPTSRVASPLAHARGCPFWLRSPARNFCATRRWITCSTSAPPITRKPKRWSLASPKTWE